MAVSKKKRKTKREPKNVRARMADVVIRITVDENPRRTGSEAHKHFEAMKGGITIRDYLAKFPEEERRVARQWLYNTIKDGYAKTYG